MSPSPSVRSRLTPSRAATRWVAALAAASLIAAGVTSLVDTANASTDAVSTGAVSTGAVSTGDQSVGDQSVGDQSAAGADAASIQVPAELAAAIDRDLGLTVPEYLAASEAALDAVDVVAGLQASGVTVVGSSIDGTILTVNVATEADRAAVVATGAVAQVGAPDTIDLATVSFAPAFDVDGGEGYAWTKTGGGSSQCSIGFTGRRISDGRPVALTAGHCTDGMADVSGGVRQLVQNAPGKSGTLGQIIGTPAGSGFGNGVDGGLIALDGAGVEPRAAVVTWGGGTGAPRASATLPVLGQSAAIVGANLCKSGSRTGWTCGTVKAVDRTVQVGDRQVNSIIASTCIQPGDSGGAALIGQTAVGINSSTGSAACGTPDYVSAFFPMISAAGKPSVATQFGSVWEPSFAVQAPTMDAIALPSNGPAVLSGTAGASGSPVTIRLSVDGAAKPVVTVRADSGRWSVDLSTLTAAGVTPGEHRVTAVAAVGTWSVSAGVDTTLTFSGTPGQLSTALIPAVVVTR